MNFRLPNASPLCGPAAACFFSLILAPGPSLAADASSPRVQFQKPNRATAASPAVAAEAAFHPPRQAAAATSPSFQTSNDAGNPLRAGAPNQVRLAAAAEEPAATGVAPTNAPPLEAPQHVEHAQPISLASRPQRLAYAASRAETMPVYVGPGEEIVSVPATRRSRTVAAEAMESFSEQLLDGPGLGSTGYCDACCQPNCIGEPACGLAEAGCGIVDPACGGAYEGDCGVFEPGCELADPACGCAEPDCGIVGCGASVGNPGPDYWCFPVCLPRFKDLRFWAGVHGFKGPRDSDLFGGRGDGNFGFQEGVNVGGRAPLVSLLFPQLSYQLGYQAVQSQLSGLSEDITDDRSQQFVTAGLFRRVHSGLQFGLAWDMMRDDFLAEEDFHQLRYEISLKSPQGREFGFWGASHSNDKTVAGVNYEAVDQYCGFIRCHFRDGGALRFWGGGTNDSEGIVGSDFVAPLNARWSVYTGFNYLITDQPEGPVGAREESWNVGINLVWHYGLMAKKCQINPHAPLFPIADNGWMFIDERP